MSNLVCIKFNSSISHYYTRVARGSHLKEHLLNYVHCHNYRNLTLNNVKTRVYSVHYRNVYGFSSDSKSEGLANVVKTGEVSSLDNHSDVELVKYESAIAYSEEILQDPLSNITKAETSKFLIPYPKYDMPYWLQVLTKPFTESFVHGRATLMIILCLERLENEELTSVLGIGPGFNIRAYFLTLHIWILHRRAMKEIPEGVLLDRCLFTKYFDVLREWLIYRKIPQYRFDAEVKNCQSFMMKFLIELDICTLDEELYPYKISETIRKHMYEDDVNDEQLKLLVKYVIRQFTHVSNLDKRHFMDAMFLWGDVEEFCTPRRLLKKVMPQLIKYNGYKPSTTKQVGTNNDKLSS